MSDDSNINDINGHNDPDLSRLYQSGERPQPPANLDAAIKSAARTNPAPRRSHVVPWLGALAASLFAAVLVVQLYPVAVHEPELSSERLDAPMKQKGAAIEHDRRQLLEVTDLWHHGIGDFKFRNMQRSTLFFAKILHRLLEQ